MKLSIYGLGYVGCVSAACFASRGHQVLGIDVSPVKLEMLRSGQAPIVEPEIGELTAAVVKAGRLTVTDQAARGVTETDLSLICVGTPSAPNGELDLGFVLKVCFDIGQAIRDKKTPHIVVLRSTLLPGSIQGSILPLLERSSGKSEGEGFHLVINPEFLREGTSVQDFHKPPKTVIGAFSEEAGDTVAALYEGIEAPLIRTTPEVAEMVKYADNLYHATKIVFANEIGRLCKSLGLDSHAVMNIFLQDTKLNVSPAYLKPGFAFGGSCLPKDIRAMLYFGKKHDVETPLLASLIQSNRRHVDLAFRLIQGSSGRKAVALLGLSFKSGTDDLRESPLVDLVEILLGKGYPVRQSHQVVRMGVP